MSVTVTMEDVNIPAQIQWGATHVPVIQVTLSRLDTALVIE